MVKGGLVRSNLPNRRRRPSWIRDAEINGSVKAAHAVTPGFFKHVGTRVWRPPEDATATLLARLESDTSAPRECRRKTILWPIARTGELGTIYGQDSSSARLSDPKSQHFPGPQ